MRSLSKQLHAIAHLFSMLILFQSCVAYYTTSSSVNEAAQNKKGRIKVKTFDGTEYIFRWIEESEKRIISIKNTEKFLLPTQNISYIKTTGAAPTVLPLNSLTTYRGEVVVKAIDDKGKLQDHKFIHIEARDSVLQGIEMLKSDTATIVVPRDQIASIKLQNKSASTVGNVLFGLVGLIGVIFLIAYIDLQQNGLDIDLYP